MKINEKKKPKEIEKDGKAEDRKAGGNTSQYEFQKTIVEGMGKKQHAKSGS